jgi:mannosylglycerate hydrolase MGH1-like protein
MTAEHQRLKENKDKPIALEQWGPYLSERQWGTVREDYGHHGDAWGYLPFDQSHYRTYRWGEDGIAGISDYFQTLCFAIALWNGKDRILKERLFGVGNYDGNHGEDVKELYFYQDNIPTHYYMEYLYKYPQKAFPYDDLLHTNRTRSKLEPEYEILDTNAFKNDEYFDIQITYAKKSATDIYIKIDITNRFSETAPITLLPTLWYYNKWAFTPDEPKPVISAVNETSVSAKHHRLGNYHFYFQTPDYSLFTENETNLFKVNNTADRNPFCKDAFHDAIIRGLNKRKLSTRGEGTKFSPVYELEIEGGATKTIYCRLTNAEDKDPFADGFEKIFKKRKKEADEFYDAILPSAISDDLKNIQRKALSGLLWSKQYYHFDVERWLNSSDGITPVNSGKLNGRNNEWTHLKNQDIIAMPDKWEYPWYAAWDLAFHCISMAMVDLNFAKHQLQLIMREWYMKPDGQLPAYEWNFSDVNPPVQACAAMEIYRIEKETYGEGDVVFLKRVFQKLLINFTWWINRKDRNGNNVFEGGFLGLDNIGVFNRSHHFVDNKIKLEQADGTSWMAMYALNMMDMALEISNHDIAFEDTATKFFEHFVLISESLNNHAMWNDEDKFFYDALCVPDADPLPLRIQSIVGLTSLFAVSTINKVIFEKLKDFKKRVNWFEHYRKKNNRFWPNEDRSDGEKILISLVRKERLVFLLNRLVNETEFLSDGGIRALSKHHEKHPYSVNVEGSIYTIQYDPGDSTSNLFGGNSNWRGPVWMPINYLIIRSIQKFGEFYGDELKVECPVGSGNMLNLVEVSQLLTDRVVSIFTKDKEGERKLYGDYNWFYKKPGNKDLVLFYEYFHGDTGSGLGASHQTGWTALVADLIGGKEMKK